MGLNSVTPLLDELSWKPVGKRIQDHEGHSNKLFFLDG